jgi:DNA-binding TFAR19-related protein (PDSD5 family)
LSSESSEDFGLKLIKLKKLKELERRLAEEKKAKPPEEKPRKPDSLKIVEKNLTERGRQVLHAALNQYPEIAEMVIEELAKLILTGRAKTPITGVMINEIFRRIGLLLKIEPKIIYAGKGEVKSLTQKLKEMLSSGS